MTTKKKSPKTTRQTFRFNAPDALSVQLAGDFTQWQKEALPMKKNKSGVWEKTVSLPPGTHHYRFIVDGQWYNDPECVVRIPNPYGSENSVREVK